MDKKKMLIEKFSRIRSDVESFINEINVEEVKTQVNSFIQEARKDVLDKVVDKDLKEIKRRLEREKSHIEVKALRFLNKQKRELDTLQAKLDKVIGMINTKINKTGSQKSSRPANSPSTKKKASAKPQPKNPAKAEVKSPKRKVASPNKKVPLPESPKKAPMKNAAAKKPFVKQPTKRHK